MNDKKWRAYHVSPNDRQSRKNFEVFTQLFHLALANKPSEVEFLCPDILAERQKYTDLKTKHKDLERKLEIAREALEFYASMDQVFGRKARQTLEEIK